MIENVLTAESAFPMVEIPTSIYLELTVNDSDSVKELVLRDQGRDRNEYGLSALRIGLLSLKHARGQIDADAVRREGDRLLVELGDALNDYRAEMNNELALALKDYFDPNSGRLQERLERLVKKDGELEEVLKRQVGSQGSELANTLAIHVGSNSPLMKMLDPDESTGLVCALRESTQEILEGQRRRLLAEFSLDNKESAISRLVSEVSAENGRLGADLQGKVDAVTQQFSLDRDDSALSRLVRKVEQAQLTIAQEFSLDNDASALSRMSHLLDETKGAINNQLTLDDDRSALSRLRNELFEILKRHEDQATSFQRDVTSALEAMKARREEALRSTTHGRQFEDVTAEFVLADAQRAGDLATAVGNTTGEIRYSKVGDVVVELGPESAAAGERIVVEAKEDASCQLGRARAEIDTARKNRGASVGVFVFSKKTAPSGQEALMRYGNDIFVIWDAEDLTSDAMLRAALSLAKGLCFREAKGRKAEAADFQMLDSAIIAIETEAKRLGSMKKWAETIQSNSGKILDEVRKMADAIDKQVEVVRTAVTGLRN